MWFPGLARQIIGSHCEMLERREDEKSLSVSVCPFNFLHCVRQPGVHFPFSSLHLTNFVLTFTSKTCTYTYKAPVSYCFPCLFPLPKLEKLNGVHYLCILQVNNWKLHCKLATRYSLESFSKLNCYNARSSAVMQSVLPVVCYVSNWVHCMYARSAQRAFDLL